MNTEQITRDINARGVYIDQEHCRKWISRSSEAKTFLAAEMAQIVGPHTNPNSVGPLREWLNARGADLENLQAASVAEALSRTEGDVHRVLELRQFVSRTPITKYQAALDRVGADGRMRDNLLYCGAVKTGRWSSTGINIQNLPRPIHEDDLKSEGTPERTIQDAINNIRGMIAAAPGNQLVVSDLASIEARVLAWLAGEHWVLDAFARGDDIYKVTYSGMTGKPVGAVDKAERFIGKVACLALGYQGGLGAFVQMAAGYNLDLNQLYGVVWNAAPQHHDSAEWMLDFHREGGTDRDLDDNVILACEVIKLGWREANPAIVSFWHDLEIKWRQAMAHPGTVQTIGRVAMRYGRTKFGSALELILPSGRKVFHHSPKADDDSISYMTQNSMTRKWERTGTYGGSLSETCAQAVSRDVLAANLPLAVMLGYDPVLLVHDEVVTEQPGGSAEELSEVLSVVPRWAKGLPLAAEGYETKEGYRK